jgi:hypothetical protein
MRKNTARRVGIGLLLVAAGAAAAVAVMALLPVMKDLLNGGSKTAAASQAQSSAAASSSAAKSAPQSPSQSTAASQSAAASASSRTQETAQTEASPRTKWLQELGVTYDSAALDMAAAEDESSAAFTVKNGDKTPRLDLGRIQKDASSMTEAELLRAAKGLLQAYYFDPPAADALRDSGGALKDGVYSVSLSADAAQDIPAMAAQVKIFRLQGAAWYAVLLIPENAAESDKKPVQDAFDSLQLR